MKGRAVERRGRKGRRNKTRMGGLKGRAAERRGRKERKGETKQERED